MTHENTAGIRLYLQPRMLLVGALGFFSGFPRMLMASTLAAWLTDSGLSMAAIGLFAWVAFPYSVKFLWAPAMDYVSLPFLSRRRSWLLCAQLWVVGMLVVLSNIDASISPVWIAVAALVLSIASASQDIVIDAYRAEILPREEYGAGAAFAVFGYRLGMLVSGAGALALADVVSWSAVYMVMAAIAAVSIPFTLFMPEPEAPPARKLPTTIWGMVKEPFVDFIRRTPAWLLVLLFILLYRVPDGFVGFMTTPFLLDLGFTKTQLGVVNKLYGFAATIVGMMAGGWLIHRYGVKRCLVPFGMLALLTNVVYVGQAQIGPELWYLVLANSFDNLASGMASAAAIAYMMSLTERTHTATQYALLSALAAFAVTVLSGTAGWIAQEWGWSAMYLTSMILGIPGLILWRFIR
ncbi:MAG: MFS transporter [Alphaproteobacteria bacterium]|nr:MFS transporter [Alphaproteobacteria bacterium]